jgi:hypothetical protein
MQHALSDQSKEEYREAAHRLYMEERQRAKSTGQRSSSPQPSSSTAKEFSTDGCVGAQYSDDLYQI